MHFETHFILNRDHYSECFDQSMLLKGPQKPRFIFIIFCILAGLFFLFLTEVQGLLAWFFFGLAILEFLSFKYRRSWWLTRQMISRNAGNKITLIFDESGIENKSVYINNKLPWDAINSYQETEKGFMLNTKKGGQQYLSKSCLDQNIQAYLLEKLAVNKAT